MKERDTTNNIIYNIAVLAVNLQHLPSALGCLLVSFV